MLNKTDLVTEAELTKLENILRKLQPDAHLIKTTNAEVDINEVLIQVALTLNKRVTLQDG